MSIGTQLREAREVLGLSLDQAAQATYIRLRYLEALESDQFELLPSSAQLRGFLRAYGEYLKLDPVELIQALEKDSAQSSIQVTPPEPSDQAREVTTSSEAIFKELGHSLKSQRELMGLSLGDVERHTHIRMHYIQALETGDVSHLPSPVQGRGMLSNYASFLGLNTETILLRFADGLQADLYDRQATRKVTKPGEALQTTKGIHARPSQLKRLFSMDLFVGGFLIFFILGFVIWGALRISRLNSNKDLSPTAPPVSEILLSTPLGVFTNIPTPFPGAVTTLIPTLSNGNATITETTQLSPSGTEALSAPTPGLVNAPVQVYIVVKQRAWMRVTVDGNIAFEGRVVPGSAYSFAGSDRVDLLTGDGASLQVYFNQQDLGQLGAFGEVVERVFSIEGVQTATPAVPFTNTPAPTAVFTYTPTSTLSPTPGRPTATPTLLP